jgi:hypothetical protein
MTTKEKAQRLIVIARELAIDILGVAYPDFSERHSLTHLACSMYRIRYGKRPTQAVIDYALYKIAW